MANLNLFKSRAARVPAATTTNHAGGAAYAYSPKHKLAQLAMTGCMNQTFYADAQAQLDEVLQLCRELDAGFIARTAVYARERGHMKDMPALLVAVLAARGAEELAPLFARVIDNGKMLRNFVQIMRSGATGRRSLGSRPKKLVQQWLNSASEQQLLKAAVGNQPSLADVVKMVHPKPAEAWREAWFAWLIGKPCNPAALPPATRQLLAFRAGDVSAVPDVPFQLLTSGPLSREQWAVLAERMGWQALRMNLNTLQRNGVFELPGMAQTLARRLADPQAVARSRVFPYQLMAAWRMLDPAVPFQVREALQDALELALINVPELEGQVVVCPDVSGSMSSPVTGVRQGATTSVRCIDVAALVAAAMLRKHKGARVLPFAQGVVNIALNPRDSVLSNAQKLAAIGGGGTRCSAPLARLVSERAHVDTLLLVSDNQSWMDRGWNGSETMYQWELIKQRNPQARLVCIDIQPYGTTQAPERDDILNVGGFSDAVFDVVAQFASGSFSAGHWVDAIEAITL